MKTKVEINEMVEHIESLKKDWLKTPMDKGKASALKLTILSFLNIQKPKLLKYETESLSIKCALIDLEDAINYLETYSESKRIKKDDGYFVDAKNKIECACDDIVKFYKSLLAKTDNLLSPFY